MARLQIVWLPYLGEVREVPFALVIDEATSVRVVSDGDDGSLPGREEPFGVEEWRRFGAEVGARSVLVTDDRVDVVDSDGDVDEGLSLHVDTETFAQSVAEALRNHLGPEIRQRVDEWAAATVRRDTGGFFAQAWQDTAGQDDRGVQSGAEEVSP